MDTSAQNTKKELLSIYEELKKIVFLIASKCKSHSESITDILARYYMQQIGTLEIILTAEKHYNRMNLSLQHIRHLPQNPETAKKWGYVELPKSQSVYHGENNRKFVHPTGSEVIYDRQGRIVVDPRYIGTWNYGTEPASISHIISDMIPYWIWGNTEDDPTGLFKRIFGMDLDELINFYEKKNKNEQ